jgi:hypothetical protein
MNRALGGRGNLVALNFGSQAYDQQREIEKLVALLRTGHRPHSVVFLDGWNDITGLARSNMRWQDRVIFHGFSERRGEIAFTPGTRRGAVDYLALFRESLPAVRYLRARERRELSASDIVPARDPYRHGFDFFEADWMFNSWEQYARLHAPRLETEIIQYYEHNLSFMEGLAHAFGFQLRVFLQPMGFFDPGNPFVTDAARSQYGYAFLRQVRDKVRAEIAAGRLRMTDASESLATLSGDRYVDIAHYAPRANAHLADYFLRAIELRTSGADSEARQP